MSGRRLGQFGLSFLIVLSLFVSSLATCVCSHHAEKVETQFSLCREHSEANRKPNSAGKVSQLDSGDECSCLQPTPKVFSKSETVKIEKQTAVLPFSQVKIKITATAIPEKSFDSEKPFYLSDSSSNLKSPRAPPAS